jgi:Mg/Co/Ni transporter MgtE
VTEGSTDHGSTDHGSTDHGSTDHGSTDHSSTDHSSTDHEDAVPEDLEAVRAALSAVRSLDDEQTRALLQEMDRAVCCSLLEWGDTRLRKRLLTIMEPAMRDAVWRVMQQRLQRRLQDDMPEADVRREHRRQLLRSLRHLQATAGREAGRRPKAA